MSAGAALRRSVESASTVVTDRMARRFTERALAGMEPAVADALRLLDTPQRRARADYAARVLVRVQGGTPSGRLAECVVELQNLIADGREHEALWGEQADSMEHQRKVGVHRLRHGS